MTITLFFIYLPEFVALMSESLAIVAVYFFISKIKPTVTLVFILTTISIVHYHSAWMTQLTLFPSLIAVTYLFGIYQRPTLDKTLHYFYAVFSGFTFCLFAFISWLFVSHIVYPNGLPPTNVKRALFEVLSSGCTTFFIKLIFDSFDSKFCFLARNITFMNKRFLQGVNAIFTLCGLLLFTNHWYENNISPNKFRWTMLLMFISTFMVLMFYLTTKISTFETQQRIQAQAEQEQSLTDYIRHVESTYNEIRRFKHDYQNVLISLNESIATNDLDHIRQTYQEIMTNSSTDFTAGVHQLPKLVNMGILPIKGIIAAKMDQAFRDSRIDIALEIPEPIDAISIETIDYVRILAILLDNALEAARLTADPMIRLAIFPTIGGGQQIIVENTCLDAVCNTTKIFEEGFSTKGQNRGLGLSNLRSIIDQYAHVTIDTYCTTQHFRQTIVFHGK